MVVDDEVESRDMISRRLERKYPNKFEILEASDGSAALEQLLEYDKKKTPIDAMTLDGIMAPEDGFWLLKQLEDKHPELKPPVIVPASSSQTMRDTMTKRFGCAKFEIKLDDDGRVGAVVRTVAEQLGLATGRSKK